jgi:hypothetical protein
LGTIYIYQSDLFVFLLAINVIDVDQHALICLTKVTNILINFRLKMSSHPPKPVSSSKAMCAVSQQFIRRLDEIRRRKHSLNTGSTVDQADLDESLRTWRISRQFRKSMERIQQHGSQGTRGIGVYEMGIEHAPPWTRPTWTSR